MFQEILLDILIVFSIPWALIIIFCPFYFKFGFGKRFYHDIMGWHTPGNNPKTFTGCSFRAKCKHCGHDILQDSQGNWFIGD